MSQKANRDLSFAVGILSLVGIVAALLLSWYAGMHFEAAAVMIIVGVAASFVAGVNVYLKSKMATLAFVGGVVATSFSFLYTTANIDDGGRGYAPWSAVALLVLALAMLVLAFR